MEEESKNLDVCSSFSLIDISCDDDFLLMPQSSNPLPNPQSSGPSENSTDQSCHGKFVVESMGEGQCVPNSCNEIQEADGSLESAEPNKTRKSSKCNLRKSLAWDNAFLTSEGILDPDELEIVSKTFKKAPLCALPGIQEDLRKSTESTTTLGSDASALESLEVELFEDIRASIKKSVYDYGRTSDLTLSNSKLGQREPDALCTVSSKKEQASHNEMKPISKMPSIAYKRESLSKQGQEKNLKAVLVHPRAVTASSGEQKSPLKPPKVLIKVNLHSTRPSKPSAAPTKKILPSKPSAAPTKKILPSKPSAAPTKKILPSECIKIKNNMAKVIGNGSNQKSAVTSKKPILGSEQSFPSSSIPSPTSSSSGSSRSTKTLSTTPSSAKKSGVTKTLRNRVESRNTNLPSKALVIKTPPKSSKSKMVSGNSHLTAYVLSTAKVSPTMSPASSIDGFSSESSSSTCTASQKSDSSKASLDISCASSYGGGLLMKNAPELPDHPHVVQEVSLLDQSVERPSERGVLSHPTTANASRSRINYNSIQQFKPSGLRMPSPKIGFFDAEKTGVRSSNPGLQFYSGLQCGPSKKNAYGINNLDGELKQRSSKLQHAKFPTQFGTAKSNSHVAGLSNQANASSIKLGHSQQSQQLANLSQEPSSTLKDESHLNTNVGTQDPSGTTSRESKSKTGELQGDVADKEQCHKNADTNMEECGDQNAIKRCILIESNKESTLGKFIDVTSMLSFLEEGAQVPSPVTHLDTAAKLTEDNIDCKSLKGEHVFIGQKENITGSDYNSSPVK